MTEDEGKEGTFKMSSPRRTGVSQGRGWRGGQGAAPANTLKEKELSCVQEMEGNGSEENNFNMAGSGQGCGMRGLWGPG